MDYLIVLEKLLVFSFLRWDTWDTILSVLGFAISVWGIYTAVTAKQAVDELQGNFTFDKRIPQHLRQIAELLSSFNLLLDDAYQNRNAINGVLKSLASELTSLNKKVQDKEIKRTITLSISRLRRLASGQYLEPNKLPPDGFFYKFKLFTTTDALWDIYTTTGEIHRSVDNIRKDTNSLLRKNG